MRVQGREERPLLHALKRPQEIDAHEDEDEGVLDRMAAGLIRHDLAVKGRHDPHFQKVERSPIRVGVTHHEATAERVVGVDLRILLSQQAREVGGEARREEFKRGNRSEEHTSELQSLMRTSYAVFCMKKK